MSEQENNRDTKGRVPFVQMVPNMVTLTGMCLGLTSIRFAVDERFMLATFLIMLAAVMDGLDGLSLNSSFCFDDWHYNLPIFFRYLNIASPSNSPNSESDG